MAKLYQNWQAELAAFWQRRGLGGFWLASQGSLKDEVEYRARSAQKQRHPSYCAPDALAAIGAERQLERPNGATDATYASKLKDAFNRWYWGGTTYGLLREFSETLPGVLGTDYTLVLQTQQNGKILKLATNTGDPTVDMVYIAPPPSPQLALSSPRRWNTFFIFVSLAAAHPWWFATPGNTSNEANTGRRVVQRWRSQHAECRNIIFSSEPDGLQWGTFNKALGTMHTWGEGGLTWGASGSIVAWTPPPQ